MLTTLILCMALDYLTGFLAAAVFKKSKKSQGGGLESRSGWKGLCRKGISLLVVLIAHRLDLIAETDFICEMVMAAYLINELLSIVENAGLMGVPIPDVILRSIDLLKNRKEQKGIPEEREAVPPQKEAEEKETEEKEKKADHEGV